MDKCEIECTQSGIRTVKVLNKGKYFYINSKYNPQKEAEIYVDTLDMKNDSIIVMLGNGFGYVANEIMKNMSNANKLIIFETNINIFNKCAVNFTKTEKVIFHLWENESSAKAILEKHITFFDVGKVIVITLPAYLDIWHEELTRYSKCIQEFVQERHALSNTFTESSGYWESNMFNNSDCVSNSYRISKFSDKFKSKPIIVVGAGPSLDKNIQLLKKIKDKAVIISGYTALRALYNNDIRPHFVVVVDSKQPIYQYCYNDIPVIYTPLISNQFLSHHVSEKIVFVGESEAVSRQIFKDSFTENDIVEVGGTVALPAVDIAVKMGGNPVILIGQDLAFYDENTHAKGTYYDDSIADYERNKQFCHNAKKMIKGRKFEIDDIYGNKVYTDLAFRIYATWLEEYFFKNKDRTKFINATEGGILKKHVEIMDLRDVESVFCNESLDIGGIMETIFAGEKLIDERGRNDLIVHYEQLKKEIQNIQSKILSKGSKQSNELLTLCGGYNNTKKMVKLKSVLEKLLNTDSELKKAEKQLRGIMPLSYVRISMQVEKQEQSSNDDDLTKLAKKNITLYEELEKQLNVILSSVNLCLGRMQAK